MLGMGPERSAGRAQHQKGLGDLQQPSGTLALLSRAKKVLRESISRSVVSSSTTPWSPPGSSVHGILQARILHWVAIPFSRGFFPPQGSNPLLLYCRQTLYHLNHQGSPAESRADPLCTDTGCTDTAVCQP